jgi:hypothetical protein
MTEDSAARIEETDEERALLRAQLRDDHEAQRALCAELEQVADGLPDLPPPPRVRRLCGQIELVATRHFPRAEAILADLGSSEGSLRGRVMRSLSEMHSLDAVHGQDLVAALWSSVAAGVVIKPGELGYMLRCYFDGCRRAIAVQEALLLPCDDPA